MSLADFFRSLFGRSFLLLALVSGGCAPPPAPRSVDPTIAERDSLAVAHTAVVFLAALDSLQWAPFAAALSDSVEVFWPRADTPGRLYGRSAVETRFRAFFEQIRAARPGPPYLHLRIQALAVRMLGTVGLVTFELTDIPDTLGRRTLVFQQERGAWKLVHLHASNLPMAAPR